MNIAAASMANSSDGLKQAAGMMVMKKAMNMETQNAAQMVSQLAATTGVAQSPPHLGKSVDISA